MNVASVFNGGHPLESKYLQRLKFEDLDEDDSRSIYSENSSNNTSFVQSDTESVGVYDDGCVLPLEEPIYITDNEEESDDEAVSDEEANVFTSDVDDPSSESDTDLMAAFKSARIFGEKAFEGKGFKYFSTDFSIIDEFGQAQVITVKSTFAQPIGLTGKSHKEIEQRRSDHKRRVERRKAEAQRNVASSKEHIRWMKLLEHREKTRWLAKRPEPEPKRDRCPFLPRKRHCVDTVLVKKEKETSKAVLQFVVQVKVEPGVVSDNDSMTDSEGSDDASSDDSSLDTDLDCEYLW